MSKITPQEKKTMLYSWLFFFAGCALVLTLQSTIGLYFTTHYFVAHFLLGLFLPFAFYGFAGTKGLYWVGFFLTLVFHLGYELWEDQLTRPSYIVDWDQVVSGLVGLAMSYVIYHWWEKAIKPRLS
ncbi:hypothetical protein [Pseudoalteromonas gelatinilytica]|uniref:DUF2238 domain-containing protein n=1 Tax=Pseudoalteromonas gelatinilytica TaxID=1703256 RepID=A0ABQ1TFY7_9GAMM|nr:hypothetical protein [Pseudoalteromonas profundi]GGE94595.1 hypothetical protein GCM10008027_19430 [Pseudoalteromonas profundi]